MFLKLSNKNENIVMVTETFSVQQNVRNHKLVSKIYRVRHRLPGNVPKLLCTSMM